MNRGTGLLDTNVRGPQNGVASDIGVNQRGARTITT